VLRGRRLRAGAARCEGQAERHPRRQRRAAWEKKLAFASGKEWDGKSAIKPGAAVGFFRVVDKKFFHAAISTGGTKIRAVNGHLLGNGWDEVDLKKVLGTPDADKQFDYDRTKIKVFVSKV
jgi:hypothetical protein